MKRIIIALSLLIVAVGQSLAAEPRVSSVVKKTFEARFANASEVAWSEADEFTVAAFTHNGQRKYAYFNESAELVVVAEGMAVDKLSDELQASLAEEFADYSVTELYKMKNQEGVRYYAVLKNSKGSLILNSFTGTWEVVKKVKK